MTPERALAHDERWRPVVGYEGIYEVSDLGRVRALRFINRHADTFLSSPRLLTPQEHDTGYLRYTLCRSGRQRSVLAHRLVLEAFVGPCPAGHEASHDDGTRANNALTNLLWQTRSDNHKNKWRHGTAQAGERSGNAKLTEAAVSAIRGESGTATVVALAIRFGVSESAIRQVIKRETWAHV